MRPAETIEDAIRKVGQVLQASRTPELDARGMTTRINTETRSGFDGVIAGWENDIALALGELGRQRDFAATATNLTAQLQGIDRGYKRRPPDPENPDSWFDHFDLQIGHLAQLSDIQGKLDALPRRAFAGDVPVLPPSRRRWTMIAAVLLLVLLAGGVGAWFVTRDHGETKVATPSAAPAAQPAPAPVAVTPPSPPKSDDKLPVQGETAAAAEELKPKVVRTITIPVQPPPEEPQAPAGTPPAAAAPAQAAPATAAPAQPAVAAADAPPLECKNATAEIGPDGATMSDRPGSGLFMAKLAAKEKVTLRRIVVGPGGFKFLDIEAPKRKMRGYIVEAEAKKPPGGFPCE